MKRSDAQTTRTPRDISGGLEQERRRPRASFTKTLKGICARLDASRSADVAWYDRFCNKTFHGTVEAIALWVVGSYARGAPTCGDLDLVFEYRTTSGSNPSGRKAGVAIFGARPLVRIYGGTPTGNSSGVRFPEAVLVWQSGGFDWESALASIKEDPTSGRLSRSTDVFPLRHEQLNCEIDQLERLVDMVKRGTISWTFTPLANLDPVEASGNAEQELALQMRELCGKRTQAMLPYLLAFLRSREWWPTTCFYYSRSGPSGFFTDGALLLLGRPSLALRFLDNPEVQELVLMPYITTRGPNGIVSLRKGINSLPADEAWE